LQKAFIRDPKDFDIIWVGPEKQEAPQQQIIGI
jgi:hypothetical protein